MNKLFKKLDGKEFLGYYYRRIWRGDYLWLAIFSL